MRYLVVIGVLFWATAGMAEELIVSTDYLDDEDMFFVMEYDESGNKSGPVWRVPLQACIDTELCGDAVEGSDVRCVRIRICGEPIR
jgi:hypothetical protein